MTNIDYTTTPSVLGAIAELALLAARHQLPDPQSVDVNTRSGVANVHLHHPSDHLAWRDALGMPASRSDQTSSGSLTAWNKWRGWHLRILYIPARRATPALELDEAAAADLTALADAVGVVDTAQAAGDVLDLQIAGSGAN